MDDSSSCSAYPSENHPQTVPGPAVHSHVPYFRIADAIEKDSEKEPGREHAGTPEQAPCTMRGRGNADTSDWGTSSERGGECVARGILGITAAGLRIFSGPGRIFLLCS